MTNNERAAGPIETAFQQFWEGWQEYSLIAERGLTLEAANRLVYLEERGRALRFILHDRGL